MHLAILLLALQASSCEPAPDLQREIEAAASVAVRDATDFDRNIAPLQELRAKHPDDVFVNERYQDGVDRHGIEGHVKAMIQEYQDRAMQAPDDVASQYLFARSLIGRNTPAAIQALIQIATDHPAFAPAHRTLAAIYTTQTFRDEPADRIEQERWRKLCPGSDPATLRTHVLPPPSPRMEEAERLLAEGGDLERVEAMALQSIQDDEWRLQRMRPFDWYGVEDKREAQRALLANYWRLWSLQVRCHRKAGRQDRATEALAQMERRAGALARSRDPGSACWNAQAILARLHAEGGQPELAGQKIALLQQLLMQQPNPDRAAQLSTLQQEIDLLRCAACVHR
jgi:hypothetical protein